MILRHKRLWDEHNEMPDIYTKGPVKDKLEQN